MHDGLAPTSALNTHSQAAVRQTSLHYPLGRLWRDAKLYEIGAGTSEIRRMLIGRELFNETM
jgi:alkylation response protein AidB-like acyl-CoA dehydrogenase